MKSYKVYKDVLTKEGIKKVNELLSKYPIKAGSVKKLRKEENLNGCFIYYGSKKFYVEPEEIKGFLNEIDLVHKSRKYSI